jgi:hypothetical protein
MPSESIYDYNDWQSYKDACPNIEELYLRVAELEKKKQIWKIKDMLLL